MNPPIAVDRCHQIGDIRVTALIDAVIDLPFDLEDFYPDTPIEAWAPWRRRYPQTFWRPNRHRVNYTAYLIEDEGLNVLIDAGMGPETSPMSRAVADVATDSVLLHAPHRLLAALAGVGRAPEDIDVVVLTHLDPDHVGWALSYESGRPRPTFAEARYVVHETDWAAFHTPGWDRSTPFDYIPMSVTPLKAGPLELMTGEVMAIGARITLALAAGHTPGHLVVAVEGAGQRLYLLDDVIAHPAQFTFPSWCNLGDRDSAQAVATRLELLARLEQEKAMCTATHLPQPCFGRVTRHAGERTWIPAPEAVATEGER